MFYKINYIANIAISAFFILVVFWALGAEEGYDDNAIAGITFAFVTFPVFIVLDIICIMMLKHNRDLTPISSKLRMTGIIVSIVVALISLLLIIVCIAMYASSGLLPETTSAEDRSYNIATVIIFVFIGVSSIINVICVSVSLKKNKAIDLDAVEAIGHN